MKTRIEDRTYPAGRFYVAVLTDDDGRDWLLLSMPVSGGRIRHEAGFGKGKALAADLKAKMKSLVVKPKTYGGKNAFE